MGAETGKEYYETLTGIAIQGIVKTRIVMGKTTLFPQDAYLLFDLREEMIWGYE